MKGAHFPKQRFRWWHVALLFLWAGAITTAVMLAILSLPT